MNKITKVTRKGILLDLLHENIDIEKIILSFFDADNLPSEDSRYDNMSGDYYQHRQNNLDWEDDWFIEDERLNFYGIDDEKFLEFISFVINPENIDNDEIVSGLIKAFNAKLVRDGFEIKPSGKKVSGRNLFHGTVIIGGNKSITFYTYFPDDYIEYNKKRDFNSFPFFEGEKEYPCIVLSYDNWDDFGYRTSFSCDFYENEFTEINLGIIKILKKNYTYSSKEEYWHTILDEDFTQLSNDYCSIFNSNESYKILDYDALRNYKGTILSSLNEVTNNLRILNIFRHTSGFETSLLRDAEPYSKIENMKDMVLNFGIENMNGNLDFNFDENEIKEIPHRIKVLIGKNGCGKTTLLSDIAKEIIEFNNETTRLTNRPSFSKIIQISYSVFDSFKKPDTNNRYIYCGLKDNYENVAVDDYLKEKLSSGLDIIKTKSKESVYLYLLKDLLDADLPQFDDLINYYDKYSSGQKILVTILAQIIANIDDNSLLLFDEPETHLHPNMIFKLIRVLYTLLDDSNSYLIIATHSPIVLQQIPSKNVYTLSTFGNSKLNLECFGENFSGITKEIFGNYEEDEILYKEIFNKLLKQKYTEKGILEFFEGKLNLNARIYLKAIFNKKDRGEI